MSESQRLFEEARKGDPEAFWQLVLPHRGLVYSVAYGLLKNHERAEDQLHDSLLHAFRSIGHLRDLQRLPGWLYSLTRNHVLDGQRRDQRARKAIYESAHEPEVITMSEVLEKEEWLGRMEKAMAALPEPFREILAMKYTNRYSIEQIAEILELTPAAVKSRLFQARKSLRRQTDLLTATESGAAPASPAIANRAKELGQ